jgi:hypothetical protein
MLDVYMVEVFRYRKALQEANQYRIEQGLACDISTVSQSYAGMIFVSNE